jgi:hypothetical protein
MINASFYLAELVDLIADLSDEASNLQREVVAFFRMRAGRNWVH